MNMASNKVRMIGINHVALEVGNIEEALAFYGELFDFDLRGRTASMAFIDMGDQFLALSEGRTQIADSHRHFGLVVDNREPMRKTLAKLGAKIIPSQGLDFLDPWGNHIQVVEYKNIQFTKAPNILLGMQLDGLRKSSRALEELHRKNMAPSNVQTED